MHGLPNLNTHCAIYVNTISKVETYTIIITPLQPVRVTTSHDSLYNLSWPFLIFTKPNKV